MATWIFKQEWKSVLQLKYTCVFQMCSLQFGKYTFLLMYTLIPCEMVGRLCDEGGTRESWFI